MKSLSFCLPAALAFASFLLANTDHALAQRIGTRVQYLHENLAGVQDDAEPHESFGSSLASGDFNADGIDDLAVGVSGEGLGGVFFENFSAGAVQILNGQWGVGLTATGSLWLEQGGTLQGHSLPGSVETPDRFGDTLAVGDLNGDGVDDLAIGAPGENDGGGVVIAVYGRRGFGLTGRDSQSWSQDTADIPDNQEDLDVFGQALAIADWNGDGIDDLAVGAYYETVGTAVGAGTVHILNGSTAGLTAAGTLQLTQDSGSLADAVETNDWFGVALVAGDFDADGRADLAISAEGESSTAGIFAGVVHLLKGSASGLTTTGNRMWSQDSTNVGGASHPYGRFGAKLAAGDFDGDGSADLAIGSPFDDPGVLDAGSVNVLTQLDDFVPILPFP